MPTATALAHMRRVGAVGVVTDEVQHDAMGALATGGEFRFFYSLHSIPTMSTVNQQALIWTFWTTLRVWPQR